LEYLLTAIIGFFLFESLGYWIHRFLHNRWMRIFWRAHMVHHLKLYPPGDFLSEKYRAAGKADTGLLFLPFAIPLVGILLWLLPLGIALTLIGTLGIVSWLNNYVHNQFHIRGSWMERWGLFWHMRRLHWIHHAKNMHKNYGILTTYTDKTFGTYEHLDHE
jgi:sterol desaturase/sphingolipid hydroxylase (fatty acid hydroxylase superfamily)